ALPPTLQRLYSSLTLRSGALDTNLSLPLFQKSKAVVPSLVDEALANPAACLLTPFRFYFRRLAQEINPYLAVLILCVEMRRQVIRRVEKEIASINRECLHLSHCRIIRNKDILSIMIYKMSGWRTGDQSSGAWGDGSAEADVLSAHCFGRS